MLITLHGWSSISRCILPQNRGLSWVNLIIVDGRNHRPAPSPKYGWRNIQNELTPGKLNPSTKWPRCLGDWLSELFLPRCWEQVGNKWKLENAAKAYSFRCTPILVYGANMNYLMLTCSKPLGLPCWVFQLGLTGLTQLVAKSSWIFLDYHHKDLDYHLTQPNIIKKHRVESVSLMFGCTLNEPSKNPMPWRRVSSIITSWISLWGPHGFHGI